MTKVKNKMNFWERNRLSNNYLLRKRIMAVMVSIVRAVLLFGLCFLILQPIFQKISVSFMEEQDLYNPIVISIPENFTTENYTICAKTELMGYGEGLRNTFVISLTVSVIQIIMCTLVGYGFSRFKFPFKKFWFAMVMLVIIIPPQTISSSLYIHFKFFDFFGLISLFGGKPINLLGSALPYYLMSAGCMGLKNGLYIYMVRQYFRSIPVDLEEAAYIDGCGTLKTFFRIMLPQAKPIITSCFLFAFVWQWTDGFYSRLFLPNIRLLSSRLSSLVESLGSYIAKAQGGGVDTVTISPARSNQILSTGTIMIIFPLIFIYLVAQRQFVESLSSTGIKM